EKLAVIELDRNDRGVDAVRLVRVSPEGNANEVAQEQPAEWGEYLRYRYLTFDFSTINGEGIYYLEYGSQRSTPFRIAGDVYRDVWKPTLDIFFPVQMDHVTVNERSEEHTSELQS